LEEGIVVKELDKDVYIKNLEDHVTQLSEHSKILGELIQQVEEDIPRNEGSKHLWACIDEANEITAGPTLAYVDQD
jgi:hypothetical protein